MARENKNGKRQNFLLRGEIAQKLEEYSAKTGIPKTTVVEKALLFYFEKIDFENEDVRSR